MPAVINTRNALYALAATSLVLCVVAFSRPTSPPPPPASVVDAVRAEISAATHSVSGVATRVDASNVLLTEIRDALTALKDQGQGRRAKESVSDQPSEISQTPLCLRVPGGPDTDITVLTRKATGFFSVVGETYVTALIRHGFRAAEVEQLDEATAHQVYDGWRSSQPQPAAPFRSVSVSSAATQYQCSGFQCRRVR